MWTVRYSRKTRDWQMLAAHKENSRLGRRSKSPLCRYFKHYLCKLQIRTRPLKSLGELRPKRQVRWVKQKTRDTTQYKIVIIYIFKKKKINIWKFSPVGKGANWKEQDWLRCRWQVRYEQLSNRGWDFFHTALIIKFPFLFVLFFVLCFVFFLEKGGGRRNKMRKMPKNIFHNI